VDIFSLPEMTLLSCVNDFFMRHNIDYEPVHLYKDVKVNVPRIGHPCHCCYSKSVSPGTSHNSLAENEDVHGNCKSDH
jgi:hypothetical protein